MLRQQDRIEGKARGLLELSSSRHPSREDQSHRDSQAVVTTAARRDTSHRCVGYHGQNWEDQDIILAHLSRRTREDSTLISFQGAHLSRRKRKDITMITFQEVGDPIDRVSSSSSGSKAIFSHRKNFRHHVGRYMLRSL